MSNAKHEFSLIEGGPLAGLRRLVSTNLGIRILLFMLIGWVPVVVGAFVEGRLLDSSTGADPLLRHFGVHVRLLIAVPLLLVAEVVFDSKVRTIVRNFVDTGLVDETIYPAFQGVLRRAAGLRDSPLGTAFVLLAVGGTIWSITREVSTSDEMAWAGGRFGFASLWYALVSRPIFVALATIWAWRLIIGWLLMWRISKLNLRLIPTHPDRAGGLGFVESITKPASIVVLALVSVIAGRWGHDVLYHGMHVKSIQPLAIMLLAVALIVFVGPLLLLSRNLITFKRQSLAAYGKLVGNQAWLMHRKWILKEDVGDPEILRAPELGPVADVVSMYNAVAAMRPAPISKSSIIPVVLAVALPLLPVFAIEIPLKEMLGKLAGALF